MTTDTVLTKDDVAVPETVEATRGSQFFVPRVDIFETEEELILQADVPGVSSKDVDLRFEKGELILQGRVARPERSGTPLVQEYPEGDFYRVFHVHESIDSTRIEAECNHGVLTVHLPKEDRVKPRKVVVRGAN